MSAEAEEAGSGEGAVGKPPGAATILAGLAVILGVSLAGWVLWARWGLPVWLSGGGFRFCQ